eukprot:10846076-Karenia_brevis.AAC.1
MQLGRSVWCSECRRAYNAQQWLCPCGIIWHHCPIHFTRAQRLISDRRVSSSIRPFTDEQASKALRVLQPQSTSLKLGPVLAARFPNLVAH